MLRPSCHYAVKTSRSTSKWQSWEKQLTKLFMKHNNFKNVYCLMTSHRGYQDTRDTCGTREQATKTLLLAVYSDHVFDHVFPCSFPCWWNTIIIRNIAGVHGFLSFTKIDKWLNSYCQLAFFYPKHAIDGHFRKQQLFHQLKTNTKIKEEKKREKKENNTL